MIFVVVGQAAMQKARMSATLKLREAFLSVAGQGSKGSQNEHQREEASGGSGVENAYRLTDIPSFARTSACSRRARI